LLFIVVVDAAVTLDARLCVVFADIEAERKLDVAVEFSTKMCGE
jgi:hypothetical protein